MAKYVSLDKLTLYDGKIKGVITAGDAAALQSAKDYADSLAVNYDAAGASATAEQNAKTYADSKDAAIAEAKKAGTDAQAAAEAADAKAVAAQTAADNAQADVDALELLVGTLPEGTSAKDVVDYVNVKTAGIATDAALGELQSQLSGVQGEVATIKGDYLNGADKTELQGNIDTEAATRKADDDALAARIKAVEDDYLKGADKTELQGNIDTVSAAVERLTNGVSADEVDGVNDLIQYVKDHGTEVTGMQEDIADNADAIEGVAGRTTTLEGKMTAVEGAVATKAEQSALDEAVEALEGADADLAERIGALEGAVGESGSVAEDIATAKQEAIDAAAKDAANKDVVVLSEAQDYADELNDAMAERVAAVESASATHALASDVTALAGRVTTAEGEIDTLQSEMDAVEALAAANDAAIKALQTASANYALKSEVTAVSDRVTTLETWHNNFTEVSEEEINALFA